LKRRRRLGLKDASIGEALAAVRKDALPVCRSGRLPSKLFNLMRLHPILRVKEDEPIQTFRRLGAEIIG